ncbi:MAG: hypothetical protein H7101_00800 [Deinococcales bacterium]|nr:hypothetical protein [Chitinophagaceae bacterium]
MYSSLQKLVKYAKYWLTAANGKGHGIHSPFVFKFITDILNDDRFFYAFETIKPINYQQQYFKKYNQLLFKIVNYYQPKKVLSIDERISNTAFYLAQANNNSQIFCFENNPSQQKIDFKNNPESLLQNVFFLNKLSVIKTNQYNLVYINANNGEDLQYYFQIILPQLTTQSVVIINNIHASKQLEANWCNIQHHASITLTIDLFQLGLIFFRPENKVAQHFTIKF